MADDTLRERYTFGNQHESRSADLVTGRQARLSRHRWWCVVVVTANLGFWGVDALHELVTRGLFAVLGVDWARFWGAARAFSVVPASGYHLTAIASFMQPLVHYAHRQAGGIRVGPAPYPPLFLKLFDIFTLPSPPLGFLFWTALNVGLAVFVARQLARRISKDSTWLVTLLLLSAFPLMMELFVGQVVVLLLACLLQAVTDLEQGHEFRAGIWTGLLVLKPQYAVCLIAVCLWKRRTSALAGIATGAAILIVGSLAVGGDDGLIAYMRLLITAYPSYTGNIGIDPSGMLGWRSLILTLLPRLGAIPSLGVVALLSLLSLGLLPLIWRGEWEPTSHRFARQLLATFAITLLVAYHSQPHGAALLIVPGSLVVADASAPPAASWLLVGTLAAAPLLGIISAIVVGDLSLVGLVLNAVLIAVIAAVAPWQEDGVRPVPELAAG